MERLSPGLSAGSGTFSAHHILFCNGAMRSDLSGVEADLGVTEDVALKDELARALITGCVQTNREKIDEAHHNDNDARSDDDSPECQTQRFLTSCFLVQVPQDCIPKQYHRHAEHDKARVSTEEWPISGKVASE